MLKLMAICLNMMCHYLFVFLVHFTCITDNDYKNLRFLQICNAHLNITSNEVAKYKCHSIILLLTGNLETVKAGSLRMLYFSCSQA